jgi:hypothetical protein
MGSLHRQPEFLSRNLPGIGSRLTSRTLSWTLGPLTLSWSLSLNLRLLRWLLRANDAADGRNQENR